MDIIYHSMAEVPGQFFTCPNGFGVMSTKFCADTHRKSKTRESIQEGRHYVCRRCPVGCMHAGEKVESCPSMFFGSVICARCGRFSNRLVSGRICVSCYNRERENIDGRNAKGNPLKLIRHYYPVNLVVVSDNAVQVRRMDRMLTVAEGFVTVLLHEPSAVYLSRTFDAIINYAN